MPYYYNSCPCAIEATPQNFTCGIDVVWHGGRGIIGDNWQFTVAYVYGMSNLISDSPSKPWRSTQDQVACSIVLDFKQHNRFYADCVAFFGCNVRTLTWDACNDGTTWGSINETIYFDIFTTGAVASVDGNVIGDAGLSDVFDDHELKNKYMRLTAGTDNGKTYKILDNVGNNLVLDITAATNIAVADTYIIFQNHTSKYVSAVAAGYRYHRFTIPVTEQTAEGYYQLGTLVLGKSIKLPHRWGPGYTNDNVYDITVVRTPHGGMYPIKGADFKQLFELQWPFSDDTRKDLKHLCNFLQGKNICLIPDHTDEDDCYLVKLIGDLKQSGGMYDHFDLSITLEEVL